MQAVFSLVYFSKDLVTDLIGTRVIQFYPTVAITTLFLNILMNRSKVGLVFT